MSYWAIKFVSAFLLPPLNFLLLGFAGMALLRTRPAVGRGLITAMIALIWVFAMPVTGNALLIMLERDSAHRVEIPTRAQAIVVLGGGVYFDGPEYAGGTVGKETLERLRYAAILYHRTGLPILVAGGDAEGLGRPEAGLMKKVLEEDFKVPVQWTEIASTDTLQNAVFSKKILDANGVKTLLLVTHGWHMARSRQLFERSGLNVITAATGFHHIGSLTMIDFLPNVEGLYGSRVFFHEAIGMLWGYLHQH